MNVKGPDSNSLSQAVADLEAIDTRLIALVAAYPHAEAGGPDPAAPIRESRELIRTIVKLLAGAQIPGGLPSEAPEQPIGGAKRRVKIKAASETTAGSSPARVEAAVRSGSATGTASAKAATRGGDSASSASAAASAAATAKAPPNSLLARLGAATPEPGAHHRIAADGGGPASPTASKSDSLSAYDAAIRLARLEAEIDSLTEASIAVNTRSNAGAPDEPAPPTAAKATEAQARRRDTAAIPAPMSEYRPDVDDEGAGDEDDAEIVIVTSESKAAGAAGRNTSSARQDPRIFRDPPPTEDDDAEVEIVQPGGRPNTQKNADGRETRTPVKREGGRERSGAAKPTAPAKWRLFRGSH